jgi:hypothetical protein
MKKGWAIKCDVQCDSTNFCKKCVCAHIHADIIMFRWESEFEKLAIVISK